jgi:hypothetical protein
VSKKLVLYCLKMLCFSVVTGPNVYADEELYRQQTCLPAATYMPQQLQQQQQQPLQQLVPMPEQQRLQQQVLGHGTPRVSGKRVGSPRRSAGVVRDRNARVGGSCCSIIPLHLRPVLHAHLLPGNCSNIHLIIVDVLQEARS